MAAKTDYADSYNAISAGIQGAAAIGGAYEQYTALKAQGDFQAAMAKINQQFANMQAQDVIDQGNKTADQIREKGTAAVGTERARAAAQGIDVNDSNSSFSDRLNDTMDASANDMVTAKSNAWKEAFGIKVNAQNDVAKAKFNQSGNNFAANQTLLTGGLSAVSSFAKAGTIVARSGTQKTTTADSGLQMPTLDGGFAPGQTYKNGWWMPPGDE